MDRNSILSFDFWKKNLSYEENEKKNKWLKSKRDAAIIMRDNVSSLENEMEDTPRERSLNEQSKKRIAFLVVCSILLISGIVLFIIIERNIKYERKSIQFNTLFHLTFDGLFEFEEETRKKFSM